MNQPPHRTESSSVEAKITNFLAAKRFAVVGASSDRTKYGNKVLRCYLQNQRLVEAVHPRETSIEGVTTYPRLAAIPEVPEAVSIITPPSVALSIAQQAHDLGIRNLWYQPGAESAAAIEFCEANGMSVIADGSCLLVVLGFREAA